MKLKQWMRQMEMTAEQFAKLVGAHRTAVVRWCSGERIPGRHIVRIMEATKGQVGPSDFNFDRALKADSTSRSRARRAAHSRTTR